MRQEFLLDAKSSHVMNTMFAKMRSLKNEKFFLLDGIFYCEIRA